MTFLTPEKEWSGSYEDGSGNRMGHSEDSSFYPCCPLCRGLKPSSLFRGSYLEEQQGHRKGCDFIRAGS